MPTKPLAAFTDYPDGVLRPVVVEAFDGNKYLSVKHADGREASVKVGYVFADGVTRRRLSRVQLHVLAGGRRHDYKRRYRKTTYRLQSSDGYDSQRPAFEDLEFDTKAAAVYIAAQEAAACREDVFVFASVTSNACARINCQHIVVTPAGEAYELRRKRHTKYLRGYGRR